MLLDPYLGCEVNSFDTVSLLDIWGSNFITVAVFAIFIHSFSVPVCS